MTATTLFTVQNERGERAAFGAKTRDGVFLRISHLDSGAWVARRHNGTGPRVSHESLEAVLALAEDNL